MRGDPLFDIMRNMEQTTQKPEGLKPEHKENRAVTALKALGSAALGFGKAQLILLGVNFVVITTGMLIAGMKGWSPLIALGISLLDLLPVIGSGIVFVPWAIVALLLKNTPMAITVGATYIAMVVLRMILDPIITGKNIGLSPLLTLAASVAGLILFGAAGAIIGPAIAAVANILFRVLFPKKSAKKAEQPETGAGGSEQSPPGA